MSGRAPPGAAVLRDAGAGDVPAIAALFNAEIRGGVALWNTVERSDAEMAAWIAERQAAGGAVLVVEEAGRFLGYGAFGAFRPHDGYAHTVEHSIYIEAAARGRGLGGAMLDALEARARARRVHVMVGGLEAGNAASYALHISRGFVETARMPEVGRKFDRWLTLVFVQKTLTLG